MKTKITLIAICYLLSAISEIAFAQGTAFTYQGRLNDGGAPANGRYDLRFAIYDSTNVPGNLIAGPITNSATAISNGLFTITLNFGTGVFGGNARWLEVAAHTNGVTGFVTLSPRQSVAPAPYAITAEGVISGGVTSLMLASSAVTGDKIAAGAVTGQNIDDGGAGAYQEFQQTELGISGDTTLAFSNLAPVPTNGGVNPTFTFTINGAAFGTVVGFSGNEGISQPYSYAVEVSSPSATINPDAELGLPAQLTYSRSGRATTFGGLVTGCTLSGSDGTGYFYSVRIESPLAYLALKTDYRIYQNLSAPSVVSSVYQTITGNTPTSSLGTYTAHNSLTQYGETSFNFVSRLMEEEGIFYFFNQSPAVPGLVLGDAAAAYLASPNSPFNYYGNTRTNIPVIEYIRSFQKASHQSTLTSTVNSYNFATPTASLLASNNAPEGLQENYEFGNAVQTSGYDQQLSLARVNRQTIERNTIAGSATAPDLRAGYTFTLNDQSGAGAGGSYLVASVHHAGFVRVTNGVSTVFYGNEFQAIPASLIFRPKLSTPKPTASPGAAVVTGPAGEEIYTDKYGRVKVQFHWDRHGASNETSSAWLRVATPMAGGNGRGMIFLPRVGDEVLVSFLEGDPDQPLIIGSLYNASNTPPYSLSANKTVSTIRSIGSKAQPTQINEIMFDDKAGSQIFTIQAAKDLNVVAANNTTFTVGNNLSFATTGSATLSAGTSLGIQAGTQTTFTGPVSAGTLSATSVSAGSESVTGGMNIDQANLNSGTVSASAFTFGAGSGEGIASKRTSGGSQYDLEFYTASARRMLILNNGNVGIGETNPAGALHITGPAGTPPSSLPAGDNGLVLGTTGTSGYKWIQSFGGPLVLNPSGNNVGINNNAPGHMLVVGNSASPAYCDGTAWQNGSDRDSKEDFAAINPREVLEKVSALPIGEWQYKAEADGTKHLGPMAQDFHSAFGLNGADDKHIATVDEEGVALAAIQGLNQKLEQKETEITELKQRLAALEKIVLNQKSN
jgi:type VI secretion system secreted protein VgrG